jgi:hypothetical protein
LLQNPTVEDILGLCPEYRAVASWDGEDHAHVERCGRYALVDLPPEVVVGARAQCRALGWGYLTADYCGACRGIPEPTSFGEFKAAGCSGVSADAPGGPPVRPPPSGGLIRDREVIANPGGVGDSLWVRKASNLGECAVDLSARSSSVVATCLCEGQSYWEYGALPTVLQRDGWAWRKLSVRAPASWTTVCHDGEVVVVSGGHVACQRPTVVHIQSSSSMMVWTNREEFAVRAHDGSEAKRMRHMRFNIGGFTHWKVLDKADPHCVWKPSGVLPDWEDSNVVLLDNCSHGLGPRYEVEGTEGACAVLASVAHAMYGFMVLGGFYELQAQGFSAAPDCAVWVFLGGTGVGSLSLCENRWRLRGSLERGCVLALRDDYWIDDGGPSSGEEDYSASDA